MVTPETSPVTDQSLAVVELLKMYVEDDVALELRLHLRARLLMVPLVTRSTLSKLKVVFVVAFGVLTTREPVLRAVAPSQIWQPVRLLVGPEPVSRRGMDAKRTSSPDCCASRRMLAKVNALTPETMFCEEGSLIINMIIAPGLSVVPII